MTNLTGIEKLNLELPEEFYIKELDLEIFKIIPHARELAEYTTTISSESSEIDKSDSNCMKKAKQIEDYLNNKLKNKYIKIQIKESKTLLREKHKDETNKDIWHTSIKFIFSLNLMEKFDEHNTNLKIKDICLKESIHPEKKTNINYKSKLSKIKNIVTKRKKIETYINQTQNPNQIKNQQTPNSKTTNQPQNQTNYIQEDKKQLLKQLEDRIIERLEQKIIENLEKKILKKIETNLHNTIDSKLKQKETLKRELKSKFHLFT
jgi:hypothetical protein